MAIKARRVTVTTTPTLLNTPDPNKYGGPESIVARVPADGTTIDIGGPDVTANGGLAVLPGEYSPAIQLEDGETLYAITATGTVTVHILEQGI